MKRVFVVAVTIALLSLCCLAQADVFNMGPGLTNLETVTVGDAGNAGELSGSSSISRICGAVGYNYSIGRYEVTAGQYTDFLNAKAATDTYGLYNSSMWDNPEGCKIQRSGGSGSYTYSVASDCANRPVNYVSFWDSCRFANWLGNGQGNGDTETGAYTLSGYNGDDGRTIQRNAGGKWAVASEDEWYKAAYYKGGGTNAGYWDYATQSNTPPSNVGSDGYTDPGNHANYFDDHSPGYSIGNPYYRTKAGEFEKSGSAYGTFDQNGNVWEWTEAIVFQTTDDYAYRHLRGGSFGVPAVCLEAMNLYDDIPDSYYIPSNEVSSIGFRLVSVEAVPEPSSLLALIGGVGGLVARLRRQRIASRTRNADTPTSGVLSVGA